MLQIVITQISHIHSVSASDSVNILTSSGKTLLMEGQKEQALIRRRAFCTEKDQSADESSSTLRNGPLVISSLHYTWTFCLLWAYAEIIFSRFTYNLKDYIYDMNIWKRLDINLKHNACICTCMLHVHYWSLLNWHNLRFRCGCIALPANWFFLHYFIMFCEI